MSVRPYWWLVVGILIATPAVVLAIEVHWSFVFLAGIGGAAKAHALHKAYYEGRYGE